MTSTSESYFITNLRFKDIELHAQELAQCEPTALVYVNARLDDKLRLGQETTLFLHRNDMLKIEAKYFEREFRLLGTVEFAAAKIVEQAAQRTFSQWFSLETQEKVLAPQILLEFTLQKLSGQQSQSSNIASRSALSTLRQLSPDKRASTSTLRIASPASPVQKRTQFDLQSSREFSPARQATAKSSVEAQQYNSSSNKYEYQRIEEELALANQRIQQLLLTERQTERYRSLRKQQTLADDLFYALRQHPCAACEKRLLPQIDNALQELKDALDNAVVSTGSSTKFRPLSDENTGPQTLLESCRCTDSPIKQWKNRGAETPENTTVDALMERYKQQETSRKQRTEREVKQQAEREVQKLRAQLRNAQATNRALIADKEGLDSEAKKLRFRVFVLESDLKTLLRKLDLDSVRGDMRNAFRLREFRTIFDHLHALLAANSDQQQEIAQLLTHLPSSEQRQYRRRKQQSQVTVPATARGRNSYSQLLKSSVSPARTRGLSQHIRAQTMVEEDKAGFQDEQQSSSSQQQGEFANRVRQNSQRTQNDKVEPNRRSKSPIDELLQERKRTVNQLLDQLEQSATEYA